MVFRMINLVWGFMIMVIVATVPTAAQEHIQSRSLSLLLKESLQDNLGLSGDFDVILDNPHFKVKDGIIGDLKIKNITRPQDSQRFIAQIYVGDEGNPSYATAVSGRIDIIMPVPVLTRPIPGNETIQEADITWQKISITKINQTMITNIQDLLGKVSTGRVLQPGQPINRYEVRLPILVHRKDLVTAVYRSKNLELTRQVESLQDGAKGDRIQLMIPDTQKTITGRIVDAHHVEIQA